MITDARYFAYYGREKNVTRFCQSKKFVERYATGGYMYSKILKPFQLLKVPYSSLYMAKSSELCEGFQLCKNILEILPTLNPSSKFSHSKLTDATISFLLNDSEDEYQECLSPEDYELYKILMKRHNRGSWNPDYGFKYIVCALGFHGWLRRANEDETFGADEIMICSITNSLRNGFLEYTEECNLSHCS